MTPLLTQLRKTVNSGAEFTGPEFMAEVIRAVTTDDKLALAYALGVADVSGSASEVAPIEEALGVADETKAAA